MKRSFWVCAIAFSAILILGLSGCYRLRSSAGGGQTDFDSPRKIVTGDIALPKGYSIEPVAAGLTFPTGITFDAVGRHPMWWSPGTHMVKYGRRRGSCGSSREGRPR